ncbi:hypothetical protein HY489_05185 [Candidatus Woesearchaeota archaeon]|nr:hypothetical protein [Candidatus Woesearchaeota archaeon]
MSILKRIKKAFSRASKRVIKKNEKEYQLLCQECGKIAATFDLGPGQLGKQIALNYNGITGYSHFDATDAPTIFARLEKDDIDKIHTFLDKYSRRGVRGIDAYCPECKKIYCQDHYKQYEERDEHNFYSCTYGTCPKGHQRIIDD